MNYLEYLPFDVNNGEGVRCTLFVAGCEIGCKGCHNPDSWDRRNGYPYTKSFEDKIIKDLSEPFIKGLSLSGGHPLHPKNFKTVLNLCKRVKSELPSKDIWLWTGLTEELLRSDSIRSEILNWVNVVITEPYVESLKCDHVYYGSSNQKLIKIKIC